MQYVAWGPEEFHTEFARGRRLIARLAWRRQSIRESEDVTHRQPNKENGAPYGVKYGLVIGRRIFPNPNPTCRNQDACAQHRTLPSRLGISAP